MVTRATVLVAITSIALAGMGDANAKRKRRPRRHTPKKISPLTANGLPNVQSISAVVFDMDTGAEYYAKNPDAVRHIASTTKIFVAMVARRRGIDLEHKTAITRVDRDFARGGARTRLHVHHSLKNLDLLRAMLVSSDNRAPTALGRAVGLDPKELVHEMERLRTELRLTNTKLDHPNGLKGNTSTARDMARAFRAAMEDKVLAEVMATREVSVRTYHSKPLRILYRNSNVAIHSGRYPVTGGKTGFTRAAGYCLLISARLDGRHVGMVFLGADGKLTRFADFYRVARWFSNGGRKGIKAASIGDSATGVGSIN